jgi:hypothetical protein
MFLEASSTAFPKLRALKGTFSVVRLEDGAVLIVEVSVMVFDPILLPERGGVVLVFTADEM